MRRAFWLTGLLLALSAAATAQAQRMELIHGTVDVELIDEPDPAPEEKTMRVNFCVDGTLEAARERCEQLSKLRCE